MQVKPKKLLNNIRVGEYNSLEEMKIFKYSLSDIVYLRYAGEDFEFKKNHMASQSLPLGWRNLREFPEHLARFTNLVQEKRHMNNHILICPFIFDSKAAMLVCGYLVTIGRMCLPDACEALSGFTNCIYFQQEEVDLLQSIANEGAPPEPFLELTDLDRLCITKLRERFRNKNDHRHLNMRPNQEFDMSNIISALPPPEPARRRISATAALHREELAALRKREREKRRVNKRQLRLMGKPETAAAALAAAERGGAGEGAPDVFDNIFDPTFDDFDDLEDEADDAADYDTDNSDREATDDQHEGGDENDEDDDNDDNDYGNEAMGVNMFGTSLAVTSRGVLRRGEGGGAEDAFKLARSIPISIGRVERTKPRSNTVNQKYRAQEQQRAANEQLERSVAQLREQQREEQKEQQRGREVVEEGKEMREEEKKPGNLEPSSPHFSAASASPPLPLREGGTSYF